MGGEAAGIARIWPLLPHSAKIVFLLFAGVVALKWGLDDMRPPRRIGRAPIYLLLASFVLFVAIGALFTASSPPS